MSTFMINSLNLNYLLFLFFFIYVYIYIYIYIVQLEGNSNLIKLSLYTLSMWVLSYKPGRKRRCINSHTSITYIDLFDIPHIFYMRIIYTHCLQTLTGYYWYIYIYIYIHTYIYQPLRSGRIWHKVNFFKAEFNRFEFRVFLLLD